MNLQEQLTAFRTKRNDALERQKSIMEAAGEEGRTLDAEESSEYDGLTTELKHIDQHVKRLEGLLSEDKTSAEQVEKSSGPTILVRKSDPDDEFLGQSYVRRVIAKALAQLSDGEFTATDIAKHRWGKSRPNLINWIKQVAGGDTQTAGWAGNLVGYDNRFTGDFVEYLRGRTIYDRLPLREVPAHVRVSGQSGIGTGFWVAEGAAIEASAQTFTTVNLKPEKVGAISVITTELLRHSSPAAERLVRDGLIEAIAQRIDETFLGGASAGVGTPAGMLAAVVSMDPSGTTAEALRRDIHSLYVPFLEARNASGLHLVTSPTLAKSISLMVNALGQTEFGGITAEGGTLLGDPLHTGDHVPNESDGHPLILMKPSDIWKIGDMGIEVALSRDATIEQNTAPTGNASTGLAMSRNPVSMFQTDSVAFRVIRPIGWAKRRAGAVQYIKEADYGNPESPGAL